MCKDRNVFYILTFYVLSLLLLIPSCKLSHLFTSSQHIISSADIQKMIYTITPELDRKTPSLKVRLQIQLKKKVFEDSMLYIVLPSSYGPAKELYKDRTYAFRESSL